MFIAPQKPTNILNGLVHVFYGCKTGRIRMQITVNISKKTKKKKKKWKNKLQIFPLEWNVRCIVLFVYIVSWFEMLMMAMMAIVAEEKKKPARIRRKDWLWPPTVVNERVLKTISFVNKFFFWCSFLVVQFYGTLQNATYDVRLSSQYNI